MTNPAPFVLQLADGLAGHGDATYRELVRVHALSIGLYAPGGRAADDQKPHTSDEVYVVVAGTGELDVDGTPYSLTVGTTVLVPTGTPHRFSRRSDDLAVVVLFAPPLT